jgi:hypothetical protein
MKKALLILAAASALIAPAATQAKPKLTPQQQLDKLLEGRVAGKPVSCISQFDTRDMQVIDKTAIVYSSGNVIYVNKTNDAERLDSDDILVTRLNGSELCSVDVIQLHDRSGGFWRGFVGLDKFVPYRRVPKAG